MKILIVAHKVVNFVGEYYDFPLGLSYIYAALKKQGFQVECLNLNHCVDHLGIFIQTVKDKQPNVVCFGGLSADYMKIEEMLELLRKHAPGVITIVGGGLITSEPELVYDLLNPDYGVIGEGEETVTELIRALELGTDVADIDGIIFRDSKTGRTTMTKSKKPIEDIDRIDFPDFEGFEVEKYIDLQRIGNSHYFHALDSKPRMLPIISSRGCPYSCSFCFHPLSRLYRQRSLDNFFEELELLISRYNINFFCVYDELLSANKERAYELCERMKTYNIQWMTQLRVNTVDEELINALKRSGAVVISYGIESASNTILKSMKKAITIEQVEYALDLTRKNGVGFQGNIIFGDCAETKETVAQSLDWYNKHSEYLLGLGLIIAYPGSPLYKYAKKHNLISDLNYFIKNGGGILNLTKISQDEFNKVALTCSYYGLKACIKHRSKPTRLKIFGKDNRGIDSYEFSAVCPFCNAENNYKDFDIGSWKEGHLLCKNCYQRYFVTFHLFNNYVRLFIFGLFLRLPMKIGLPFHRVYTRIYSLSHYSFRQNLRRIGRFLMKKYKFKESIMIGFLKKLLAGSKL